MVFNFDRKHYRLSNLRFHRLALEYLLEEISTCQDMKSMPTSIKSNQQRRSSTLTKPNRKCILCDQAGRPSKHWLSECRYLPDHDKKFMVRSRQVDISNDYNSCEYDSDDASGFPTSNRRSTS